MPEIPILGQNKVDSAEPGYDDLTEEQKEQLSRLAAERENPDDLQDPDAHPVIFAYWVTQNHEGQYVVVPDVTQRFTPDRVATADDVIASASVAITDLQATKSAQFTAMQMAQMGQMMRQQAEAARISEQVLGGNPRLRI